MFSSIKEIVFIITLGTSAMFASALPAEANTNVARSTSGDFTHYSPGLGACGQVHGDGDAIVAISKDIFGNDANPNNSPQCNRRIRAYYNGKSAEVTVVDKCMGCAAGDLDFSPSVFRALVGATDIGRVRGTWDWI
ncbi:MRSP1/expansin-like protein [Rhypophila decipiens]|uniref:MRSP1/expansin-like protein n=1 Tax=Rhypophila decipiens TaxID=261697 RepID=A0AAN6Y2C9_9PEZI|nr:MRSP1/expansin-like protein [Rhypophila decipiens]